MKLGDLFREIPAPTKKLESYRHAAIEARMDREFPAPGAPPPLAVPEMEGVKVETIPLPEAGERDDPLYRAVTFHGKQRMKITVGPAASGKPLVLDHLFYSPGFYLYRLALEVEEGVNAVVLERWPSGGDGVFALYGWDVTVNGNASLAFHRVTPPGFGGEALGSHKIRAGAGSRYASRTFDFGGEYSYHLSSLELAGAKASAYLHGFVRGTEASRRGNVWQLIHDAPGTVSRQRFRQIVEERATVIFDGKVVVTPNGRGTDSDQRTDTLLLGMSVGAKIAARPQMEIYTDELSAGHGASVGHLDEEFLFYLTSRGIPRKEAKALLVRSFLQESLEAVDHPEVRALIEKALP